MQTLYIPLEKVHNLVPSGHSKHWLIRHSMASTAHTAHMTAAQLKMADQAWILEV